VLELPPGRFDLAAMLRDTRASPEPCPRATKELRALLTASARRRLDQKQPQVRALLAPQEAYLDLADRANTDRLIAS